MERNATADNTTEEEEGKGEGLDTGSQASNTTEITPTEITPTDAKPTDVKPTDSPVKDKMVN